MKFLHLADVHAHRDRWGEVEASLDVVEEKALRESVDLIAIAGDHAHGPLQDSERDVLDRLCARYQRLGDIAPLAIIEGTPSHDAPGSLEVFERLSSRFGITILRPGKAYYLDNREITEASSSTAECILFGIPEPTKKWLLAGGQEATGKDASDESVRAAMRGLLLGLGGLRREHSELPCVLLYHGQVSGAKTGTGYEAGSGIMVSRDDLAQVGADYLALGDIHEPQQIPGLPAYYPGSVYPINWGETHKAGCNLVEIDGDADGWARAITRIDFPHPQRKKISTSWPIGPDSFSPDGEVAGRMVWVEVTTTRELAADFNAEASLQKLLAAGALPGSRVTLNVLPTETVRAGEITEKKRLRDKVTVWGENSEVPIPETALAKADELEREATAQGVAGSGAYLRIDRLRLRGAIGIFKKSKKDEIDLDLEALGAGVFALVSPNGAGKTTILENMHPWPCMLTRDGTLKDHFRLQDSARELWFTDERTGWKYRALINIRADIASGTTEYFLYRDQGEGEKPYPGINGRKESYEAAIAQLFGSLEMYLQTAFVTQRPSKYAPELSQATQGQRKALFVELSGISYLERYREAAKAKGDALDAEVARLDASISAGEGVDAEISEEEAAIRIHREDEDKTTKAAEASQTRGRALKAEHEALSLKVTELDRQAARRSQIEREIADLSSQVREIEEETALFQQAAEGRGAAANQLKQIEELEGNAAALRAEKAAISEANHKALLAHSQAASAARNRQDEARRAVEGARRELAGIDQSLAVARSRLSAPIKDHCPTCGQLLPEAERAKLSTEREVLERQVGGIAEQRALLAVDLTAKEDALASIQIPTAPEPAPFPGAAALAALEGELAFADLEALREIIRKADEATVRIEEAGRRKTDVEGRKGALEEERISLIRTLSEAEDPTRQELAAKSRELEAERDTYTRATSAAAAARASAEAAEKALAGARERAAKRDEAQASRDEKALMRDDWRLLERAVGPNGIQALELDALAPSIAAVSNKLLAEAYGSRYQIEFRTTRIAGTGKKTKQVEDFEIVILDSETGDEQTIDSLSGGEAVWIRKALYAGFGIIRAQNAGVRFQTQFLDEADGALDPEARMLYLRMLEAEHKAAGRFQTIIVTHSKELQAMVERTIDVATLGPRETKNEGGIAA
jgi:exonuclease SbcC